MLITKNQIHTIAQRDNDHCVSIYIRTHRAGQSEADRIRWKNACSEAAEKLINRGVEGRAVRQIMKPADSLVNDNDFWLQLSDGLCMFLSEGFSEKFILPVNFENRVFVQDHFVTGPLYLYFNNRQRFFIYDISKGHNRFFEANKDSITPVVIKDLVPSSISDIPELDDLQENLQHHGKDLFHGHGSNKDGEDVQLKKYLKALSDGMHEIFVGENVPLVLSGPEKVVAMFREVNDYSPTLDMYVSGSNEEMEPVELHERAWQCIEAFRDDEHSINPDIVQNQSMKNMVLTDADQIIKSIHHKNISRIILNENFQKKEDSDILELDGLMRSASEAGADILFARENVMNKLKLDIIAFKYY